MEYHNNTANRPTCLSTSPAYTKPDKAAFHIVFTRPLIKPILILMTYLAISGCSVIGEMADEILVIKGAEFGALGSEIDSEIIQDILTTEETKEVPDNLACPEEGTRQVCTAKKGCWCEES